MQTPLRPIPILFSKRGEKRPAKKLGVHEKREMEMLLDEIPHATSPHHHHDNGDARAGNDRAHQIQQMHPAHDMHGCAANDDGPSPSHGLLSGHGHGAGHAWMTPPPLLSDCMMEELGLVAGLRCLSIGDGREAPPALPPAPALANGGMSPYLSQSNYGNNLAFGGALGDVYGEPRRSVLPNHGSGLQQHCSTDADLSESWLEAHLLDARASCSNDLYTATENFLYRGEAIGADGAFDANLDYKGTRGSGFPSSFLQVPHKRVDLGQDVDALNSLSPVHAGLSKQDYSLPYSWAPQSVLLSRNLRNIEAFGCEDSSIMQGKGLHFVGNRWHDLLQERKRSQLDDRMYLRGVPVTNVNSLVDVHSPKPGCSPSLASKFDYLMGIEGYMCYIAKNQHGCRFLQRKFDEGRHFVDFIFDRIIDHIEELMVDPFGNYLMQKLLDVCSDGQRMRIIRKLMQDAEELVRISIDIHGTRAVQKLIETLKTRLQIALVISALRPGILDLIKDLNGNHVVQRCLQTFTAKDNKFIFDAATKHCVDIATHQYGCCILQRCISHSTGEDWRELVAEISANGLTLAQDCFGNYVVQYILELKSPLVIANLVSQFEGNYVQLSMQKFSSHVVEKCLKVFGEDDRETIILELLSVSQFEQLLQDPYANYVIQSALQNTKGSLRSALVNAIHPHAAILRTSPYCKRIFSQLKK
ncbi:putative pumilio homolog 8, chloroplastic [Elaeis guineensis]|uniref:Pumilio homolog 8, chloroplastic n=1 Tax=Elaeis guineensis var. tenera TaxID=51953 RepID=A0A6I9QZJ1_ELAGV|nr:putative pumilio homolog 8, chloroplastic [Elaeis guineensis]